ncbi:MAG: T9SS type A sorting domain-containing protein [Crocinitomicaceae bacterium]|nr:T9SS type A sorting domain-containing protein [Crocinitomicaceae bacterium]
MLRILSVITAFCFVSFGYSQLGIGKWRSHPAGHQAFLVDHSETKVYVSLGNSLMTYDKESGEIDNWNSVNALTDVKITALQYDNSTQTLFLGYENGNLDLIRNNTVYNIPSIRLSNIIGLKSIQRFTFKDQLAYICTGFGVVVVDPIKFEVKDTYYPTSSNYFVYDLDFFDNKIYVATENGIYYGQEGNPLLPAPGAWTALNGIDLTAKYTELEASTSRLFFLKKNDGGIEDTLYYLQNAVVTQDPIFNLLDYSNLNVQNDSLILSFLGGVQVYDSSLTLVENIFQYPFDTYPLAQQTVKDGPFYWIADAKYCLVRSVNAFGAETFNSGGPYRTGSYKLDYADGKIGMVGGYINAIGGGSYNQTGINLLEDENWINFHRDLNPQLDSDTIYDFTTIAINPDNANQVFFGSASSQGVFEIKGNQIVNQFDNSNSTLQKRSVYEDYYLINDMSYDYDGNLWVGNSFCVDQLLCRSVDGQWYSYDLGATGKNILMYELFVDYYNLKWIGTRQNGIIVYDDNGTPDIPTDDRKKTLSTADGNGALPSGDVFCITMDFDEEIWIGTATGLAVIYSPQLIWDGDPGEYDAQRILVERDGFVEVLLGETPINDIEVDGANRKWIATQGSGVFLISEDGTEEIHHFTASNSPLLSDDVFDLDINHVTGEVFFGTELGLCSYRSDATYGDFDFADVYSYPNPVKPEFTGNITITGFAFDSDVRITDIAGNLVFRTTSNGGTVLWDGKTTNGERVKSGVYIVWAGEKNDKGRAVTKILFIN